MTESEGAMAAAEPASPEPARLIANSPTGEILSARALSMGVAGALGVGGLVAVLVASGSSGPLSEGARWFLYMVSSSMIAAILGLIFGVPRGRTEFVPGMSERYASNSNLEQISDWLTKLLVGAGLVQLTKFPGWLESLGSYLGRGMTIANASAFCLAAVLYGAGVGFMCGYLWTRLRMRLYLEAADVRAADASKRRALTEILRNQNEANAQSESGYDMERAAGRAIEARRYVGSGSIAPVLWVDDKPANNKSLIAALQSLDVEVDLARSTDEALQRFDGRSYGLIISDLGREEGPGYNSRAGLDLLDAIRAKDKAVPIIIFGTYRALGMQDELRAHGATIVTTRASELLDEATRAVTATRA